MIITFDLNSNGSGVGAASNGRSLYFVGNGSVPFHAQCRALGIRVQTRRVDNGSRGGRPVPYNAPISIVQEATVSEEQFTALERFADDVAARELALAQDTQDPAIRSYLQYWTARGLDV